MAMAAILIYGSCVSNDRHVFACGINVHAANGKQNPRINQNKIKTLIQIFMNSIVYIIGAVVVVVVILKVLGLF